MSIKQKPGAAHSSAAAASNSRGSQKRKISDVQSPMGSLSSAVGSPITRPEAPYPIAHASRWSDLGLLGSPAFTAKVASPNWALPSGMESPFAKLPSKHADARLGVSLPATSMLASHEVRHTSFRFVDCETLFASRSPQRAVTYFACLKKPSIGGSILVRPRSLNRSRAGHW